MDRRLATAIVVLAAAALPFSGPAAAGPEAADSSASGFVYVKTLDQAACQRTLITGFLATYYTRGECMRVDFNVTNTDATSMVAVDFIGPDGGAPFLREEATRLSSGAWRIVMRSGTGWPAGKITLRVVVNEVAAGDGALFVNALGAAVSAVPKDDGSAYQPGEQIQLEGSVAKLNDVAGATQRTGVPATFWLRVRPPSGEPRGPYGPFTAGSNGAFPADTRLPADATAGITADATTDFRVDVAVDVVDAQYTDPSSGPWANTVAGTTAVTLAVPITTLLVENSFVSSVGWVKPGEMYPFRIFVKNFTGAPQDGAQVVVAAPSGTSFASAQPLAGAGTASVAPGSATWNLGPIAADTTAILVVEAVAATAGQDPEIVWKDLSTTATLTYDGGPPQTSESHGPKVIPPTGGFDTARYGDKPFPMVPVDFRDRKHKPHRSGEVLARVVNSVDHEGSTFNLYQEMSFGQMHPIGAVPSAGIATADFTYEPGFDEFTERDLRKPQCRGATLGGVDPLWGTAVYPERIQGGWYQLPGDTEYYGGDHPVFTATTIGIDAACGSTSKMIFDACTSPTPRSTTTSSTPTRTESSTSPWSCLPAAAATAPPSSRSAAKTRFPTTTPGRTRRRWRTPTPTR